MFSVAAAGDHSEDEWMYGLGGSGSVGFPFSLPRHYVAQAPYPTPPHSPAEVPPGRCGAALWSLLGPPGSPGANTRGLPQLPPELMEARLRQPEGLEAHAFHGQIPVRSDSAGSDTSVS